MTDDADADEEAANGDLFSRSVAEHRRSRREDGAGGSYDGIGGSDDATGGPDDGTAPVEDDDRETGWAVAERYRRRLGLSELQWAILTSLALALPYPVLFYLFFTARLTSLPLLLATLVYSLAAMYANRKL